MTDFQTKALELIQAHGVKIYRHPYFAGEVATALSAAYEQGKREGAEQERQRFMSDRPYVIGWNDGFEHAHGVPDELSERKAAILEQALEQYRDAVDRLNRATDQEIDKAMAEILAKQGSGRHLKPLPSNFDQIFRKRGEA